MVRRNGCSAARVLGNERGTILIFTAVTLLVLFSVMALGVDMGFFRYQQRRMQTAADAAAVAGATQLLVGGITSTAQATSASLGFTDGTAGTTVTVNHPPASGPYAGSMNHVEAIVFQPQPTYFAHVLGRSAEDVHARAVAENSGRMSRNCIYALAPTQSGTFHIESGDRLNSTCGIVVNSSSPTAMTISGLLSAPSVSVVGGHTGRVIGGIVKDGTVPVNDPLAYLTPPPVGPCTNIGYRITSGTATLNPGVYCDGLFVAGTAQVTLKPGTYVMAGGSSGSLSVGGTGRLTGSGVTIYNSKLPGYPYQPINFQDASVVNVSAPTTGPLAGILMFQDRSVVSTAENVLGGSAGSLTGAIYFPTTPLAWANRFSDSAPYTIVVAKTINVSMNLVNVNSDYSSLPGGSPIRSTLLVE